MYVPPSSPAASTRLSNQISLQNNNFKNHASFPSENQSGGGMSCVCGGTGTLTRHSGFNEIYVFGVTAPLFSSLCQVASLNSEF